MELKIILEAINKINNSEIEKIDLGSIDDLKKEVNDIQSFLRNYRSLAQEVSRASQIIQQAKKLNDEGFSLRQKSRRAVRQVIKQADELGVEYDSIPSFREYMKASGELDTLNSEILRQLPR